MSVTWHAEGAPWQDTDGSAVPVDTSNYVLNRVGAQGTNVEDGYIVIARGSKYAVLLVTPLANMTTLRSKVEIRVTLAALAALQTADENLESVNEF